MRVKKDIELKILKSETLQESSDSIKKANIRLWVYQKERKQRSVKERITELPKPGEGTGPTSARS